MGQTNGIITNQPAPFQHPKWQKRAVVGFAVAAAGFVGWQYSKHYIPNIDHEPVTLTEPSRVAIANHTDAFSLMMGMGKSPLEDPSTVGAESYADVLAQTTKAADEAQREHAEWIKVREKIADDATESYLHYKRARSSAVDRFEYLLSLRELYWYEGISLNGIPEESEKLKALNHMWQHAALDAVVEIESDMRGNAADDEGNLGRYKTIFKYLRYGSTSDTWSDPEQSLRWHNMLSQVIEGQDELIQKVSPQSPAPQ